MPQEKLIKNTNHENTHPKENIKPISKNIPELKQENTKKSKNEVSEKQPSKVEKKNLIFLK
jgi:hypothetical protein